jgi:hypothetical protein
MTLHPDGLSINAVPETELVIRDWTEGDFPAGAMMMLERRSRTAEAKVTELERQLAWLRGADFSSVETYDAGEVYAAKDVDAHLASSPPPEWKTPHDNS